MGVKIVGIKKLDCGHDDTLSHAIVNMGTALLVMLPYLDQTTLRAWQDVFLAETIRILELHGINDKPAVDININMEMAERVTESMKQAIEAHEAALPKVRMGFVVDGPVEEI